MANGQPQQGGPVNQVNPNAPSLDMGPSLVQTGITMMASGMADDGTITPGSAQALATMGQGIAHRMQDRWWRQEFENFQSTKGAEVKMQGERTRQEYNLKLQEAMKLKDPMMRMQAMNETHGWAVEQMSALDQQYLDQAANFANNPYISQQAGQLLQQRRDQWNQLAGGPQQAAETVGAQEQAMNQAGQREVQMAQIEESKAGTALRQAQLGNVPAETEKLRAETGLVQAQTEYYRGKANTVGMSELDKVMPQVMNAGSVQDKISIITQTPKGKDTLDSMVEFGLQNMRKEFSEDVKEFQGYETDYEEAKTPEAKAQAKEILDQAGKGFFNQYGIYADEATDKDSKALYKLFEDRNRPRVTESAIDELESGFQAKWGRQQPEAAPAARKGPLVLQPGQEVGGIRYNEPQEVEPTAAAMAWGVKVGTPEEAAEQATTVNKNVQDYFERQSQPAPAPFDITKMEDVLAETGKSYDELVVPRQGKPLPPKERDAKVKQLADKAKQVLQTPEDAENRDYRINKGLLHLAVQYSRITGKQVSVDQFMDDALGIAAMKPEDKKARVSSIREDIKDINNLLTGYQEPGVAKKLIAKRTALFDELDKLGEASTPLRTGIRKVKGAWLSAKKESERRQGEEKKKIARLTGE